MRWWGRRQAAPGWYQFRDVLDSAQEGMSFVADVRVQWHLTGRTPADELLAARAGRLVRVLAEPVARTGTVLRPQACEQDINDRLLRLLPLRGEDVTVGWARVSMSVDPATTTIAERFAQARQEVGLGELARQQAAARMAFMRSEILRDPASARIYLMMENTAQHGAPPPGADIDDIVRQVQQWHPQSRWVVIAQLLDTFVGKLTPKDADDLVDTLRLLFVEYGHSDLAEQLPPRTPEPPR